MSRRKAPKQLRAQLNHNMRNNAPARPRGVAGAMTVALLAAVLLAAAAAPAEAQDNARLRSITSFPGTLYPAFSPDTLVYVLQVPARRPNVTVAAETAESGASIAFSRGDMLAESTFFTLSSDHTGLHITVTSRNGRNTLRYVAHVVRGRRRRTGWGWRTTRCWTW